MKLKKLKPFDYVSVTRAAINLHLHKDDDVDHIYTVSITMWLNANDEDTPIIIDTYINNSSLRKVVFEAVDTATQFTENISNGVVVLDEEGDQLAIISIDDVFADCDECECTQDAPESTQLNLF